MGLRVLWLLLLLVIVSPLAAQDDEAGMLVKGSFESETLGRDYEYFVYLPAGYEASELRYPVVYMLHGRGDDMYAWWNVKDLLDTLIASEELPPLIAVMPDVPSSDRASYYIDSEYTGADFPSEKVETAFFSDLIPHIDASYRTIATRAGRVIAGYSMGGYGAIRYALAHPDVFQSAIVLSPAVYTPQPPLDSSARLFGAFGVGDTLFDEARYESLNYPALIESFKAAELPLYLFLAVGDDEWKHPDSADQLHDLDMETHLLYNRIRRVPRVVPELRVYDGGHDWELWRRGFEEGIRFASRFIAAPQGGDAVQD
ncbi:MAG: alpha/beta fold hydrolase [Chloroflexota bacterium]|nr:MAG: esterase [Chloroflexota bacterium]